MLAGGEDRESIVKASLARGGDATGSVRMSNTILRTAMQSGEAILSADALEDSRFDASESLDGLGIRSMICVPLMAKGGEALGAIQLQTQSLRHQFTQSDLDVLISVGSQAILAIENARLHEDLLRRSDIERELRFATQVQLGFLPEIRPEPAGLRVLRLLRTGRARRGRLFRLHPVERRADRHRPGRRRRQGHPRGAA